MILDEDQEVWLDAFNLFLGERIARGQNREVFNLRFDSKLVIKIEKGARIHFQNILEWATWNNVVGTKYEKWFAPCVQLSHEGRLLVMEKTKPVRVEEMPECLPVWMCDFKIENFGWLGDRIVWHDYGKNLLGSHGLSHRVKKVTWRTGDTLL